MQVASIIEPQIAFKVRRIQFQKGSADCGLFAIAYATDLAFGNAPASFQYEQGALRAHFLDCISNNKLVPFPKKIITYTRPKTGYTRYTHMHEKPRGFVSIFIVIRPNVVCVLGDFTSAVSWYQS